MLNLSYSTIETIKLGIFFFLLFTAYSSFQTMATYIYENQGLSAAGPLNFVMNYVAFMISNMFAPKCKASFKTQMIIGCIGHGINCASGIYVPYIENKMVIYGVISFGGLLAGSTAGFLWISKGGYLREVIKTQPDKGKYSSIFQLLYSFAGLISGFINTLFIGYFSRQSFFAILTALAGSAGIFAFVFLRDIRQTPQQLNSKEQQSVCQDLKQTFKFYPKMWPILAMILMDGIVLGMYCNQVIRLMPEQNDKVKRDRLVGTITIFMGLGCMLGGFVSGGICDKFGLLNSGKFYLFFVFICAVTTSSAMYYEIYELVCFVGFLWGCTYYFIEGWIYVAILKVYSGKLEAFSINKQLHCLSFASFQTMVLLTENHIDLKILVPIVALLALPTLWSIGKADYSNQILLNQINDKKRYNLPEQSTQYSAINYSQIKDQND